ncbi:MAG: hypothetical protein ACRDPA_24795 [Solirubrobacteraceae bacterium]
MAPERGQTTTVGLTPPAGTDFSFQPGQFAWFAFGRSPFSLTQHPFSFSSSAERSELEVAIKSLGDFTSTVSALDRGRRCMSTDRTACSRSIRTRDLGSDCSPAEPGSQA